MSTDKRTIDWYNKNAQAYADHLDDEKANIYHKYLEKPAIYSLLPDLAGKKVLVLGTGPGADAAELKKRGADQVVGTDISQKLIEIAKQTYPDCEFHVMDMEKLDFEDESFDLVFSSLAVHYLATWNNFLAEAFRVLKPGGQLIFSSAHPLSDGMQHERIEDKKVALLGFESNVNTGDVKTYGQYFDDFKIDIKDPEWIVYHHSLETMVDQILGVGFDIRAIKEPRPQAEMKKVDPRHYAELVSMPWAIIFKLQKQSL